MPQGKPVRPKWLKGRGAGLWDEMLAFAFWLTLADSYKLAHWCDREAFYEDKRNRDDATAADRREHRASGSELGLDPSSRSRMGVKGDEGKKKDPAAEFLS